MKSLKCNKGFTMIEILVVITMLGILVAIVAPQVTKQLDKPKKSRAIVEIKTMKNVMDLYYAENNKYPETAELLSVVMQENGVLGGRFGGEKALDPWGRPYYINTALNSYTIWSEGPDISDEKKDDIYTSNGIMEIEVKADNLQASTSTVGSDGKEVTSEGGGTD